MVENMRAGVTELAATLDSEDLTDDTIGNVRRIASQGVARILLPTPSALFKQAASAPGASCDLTNALTISTGLWTTSLIGLASWRMNEFGRTEYYYDTNHFFTQRP